MCGFAGYCYKKGVNPVILEEMRDSLVHRGPDDAGLFISSDKTVGLAHRRLSIIDLTPSGRQPMSNEDSTIWIVYNGEIYNYQELRKELIKKGHIFLSNTDTEIIIHAYEEWGAECLERFLGMFAFVIYDLKKNSIFLARDRFGIKPLHYGFLNNGVFAFASEIKAIAKHPNFKNELNINGLISYFKYRYIPSPDTIWKNVFKLPPANFAIYDLRMQKFDNRQYYKLVDIIIGKNSTIEEVEYFLKDSVKKRLISDVEVGSLLSGGIDSSTVTALACEEHPAIKSFSIGFEPKEFSELSYSKIAAEYLKTNHIISVVDNFDDDILEKLAYYYDEPLADSSCIPTYILCGMTASNVKVALSGDGGDEIFSGYNWYDSYKNDYNNYNNNISSLKKFLNKIFRINLLPDFENYYNRLLLNRYDDFFLKKLLIPDIYNQYDKEKSILFGKFYNRNLKSVRALQYIDINTFMVDDILTKVDRASMAHSLEIRVPLLDHRLVEAVFSLPENEFPSDSTDKPILKKIMKDKLPSEILNREKKGFSAPVHKWKFYKNIRSITLNGKSVRNGILNKEFISDLVENKYPNSRGKLWMAFLFENWFKKWIV